MTLFRQLLLFSLLILIGLCTGLWIGELQRTRHFLINQLESHAQDTATSLGLSLSTLAHGTDIPAMEAMISALFDRGYYRHIQLRDIHGTVLIERLNDVTVDHVPSWFIRLTPLTVPRAEAMLMQGWQQTGMVVVESHPGYAYQTLWDSVLSASLWFALAIVTVALIGGLGMRRLLSPLQRVEEQAVALCDRRFHLQEHLPRTRELRRVVLAMNRMTERVREMFEEQATLADTLRQRAYQDALTGLGNRRYLETQVQAKLHGKETVVNGAFLMFHVQGLHEINQEQGYTAGDQLIGDLAGCMQQAAAEQTEVILGRLGGGDLAALLPNMDKAAAHRFAVAVLDHLAHRAHGDVTQDISALCGGVVYDRPTSFSELLTTADAALNTARYQGATTAVIVVPTDVATTIMVGRSDWRALLETVLTQKTVNLHVQPTVARSDQKTIVHHEILTRIHHGEGRHLSAGALLPLAEQLGVMPALDRIILEHIFALPALRFAPPKLAINLSPLSLTDGAFTSWLLAQLQHCTDSGLQLSFEFPEFRAMQHLGLLKSFAERIRPMGHALGIDHFGQGLTHFGYLHSLLPEYVKLDRAITNEVHTDQGDSAFFVSTLCTVAHSLDIRVIVEGIETERQWHAVTALPVDAVQGYFIQRPEPVV